MNAYRRTLVAIAVCGPLFCGTLLFAAPQTDVQLTDQVPGSHGVVHDHAIVPQHSGVVVGGPVMADPGVCCPECEQCFVPPPSEFCQLKISNGKEKRECYEVEYKSICIPKVIPPWKRDCCEPLCGEVRSVKVLKRKSYECPRCEYEWSVQKPELIDPATGMPVGANTNLPMPQAMAQPFNPTLNPRILGNASAPTVTSPPPAPATGGILGDYFRAR